MKKTVVATKEFTNDDVTFCAAVSGAMRAVAAAFLEIPGVAAGNVLDGMLSAYFNEAMRLMGPKGTKESIEHLVKQLPYIEALMSTKETEARKKAN